MTMKVIGKQFVEGEYKGFPFATVKLHCERPLKDHGDFFGSGVMTQEFKLRKSSKKVYDSIPLGAMIELTFDYYGNVIDFQIGEGLF